jgi:hypothetical protein
MNTETLRAAYATATVAHESAARAAYRAEVSGSRTVGLARHRERLAWQKACAARAAYEAAVAK